MMNILKPTFSRAFSRALSIVSAKRFLNKAARYCFSGETGRSDGALSPIYLCTMRDETMPFKLTPQFFPHYSFISVLPSWRSSPQADIGWDCELCWAWGTSATEATKRVREKHKSWTTPQGIKLKHKERKSILTISHIGIVQISRFGISAISHFRVSVNSRLTIIADVYQRFWITGRSTPLQFRTWCWNFIFLPWKEGWETDYTSDSIVTVDPAFKILPPEH